MPVVDHLGITVTDLPAAVARFAPILDALGFAREDGANGVSWWAPGETELILYPAREADAGPHVHGRPGWQHLAFAIDSRDEVERLHALAVGAGWTSVRDPKVYPRYNDRYYASFLEDVDGIRIEFMHNPGASTTA